MSQIPMVDLQAQYRSIQSALDTAMADVIQSSAFIGGKYVEQLEQEIAAYCGTKYAVGLNSGTDALYMSLWAKGIGKGDEVITTPFTFFATAEVISRLEATPVFVDIDPSTFNIDMAQVKQAITPRTKAVIPVHLFGLPADMDELMALADEHDLFIIEDACQAIGSMYKGKQSGAIGHTGCFSFFPSKNLGAYGDGGMVVTNDAEIAEFMKMMRNHGSKVKYYNDAIGVSSRLDGLQAAILSAKLPHLDDWNKQRNRVAETYNRLLADLDFLTLPAYELSDRTHVYHQYTVQVADGQRDAFKAYLDKNSISNMIYYPVPLHLLKAFEDLKYTKGAFPVTEKAAESVISLPIYPELADAQVAEICDVVKGFHH
jgi:dTDP-4-amino-4,6-dideoxygalactose transaminase